MARLDQSGSLIRAAGTETAYDRTFTALAKLVSSDCWSAMCR
jgi:hypothetical protein